jgi:glycosyltransferase involved in cell wall biosynthesis
VALDDGSERPELAEGVAERIRSLATPARFVRLLGNVGRARGRNRLARHARAPFLLFLDSDMRPDREDFLQRWIEVSQTEGAAVACGGFRTEGCPVSPETELHRALAARSECLPAEVRRRAPAKYVYTNNLLVRRDVFEAERFDESFVGWGWEDVEWGLRVARRWTILHVENPAQNCGLSTVDTLMRKYQQAVPNFARMRARHPDVVETFPSYRIAQVLKPLPFRGLWLRATAALARTRAAPMRLRELAIRGYRAGLYAGAL